MQSRKVIFKNQRVAWQRKANDSWTQKIRVENQERRERRKKS